MNPRGLHTIVVVPARNEEQRIGSCLEALANQDAIEADEYEVIVVLDECTDGTGLAVAEAKVRWPRLRIRIMDGPGKGAGKARAIGMNAACSLLEAAGREHSLLATTDADTVVAHDWIAQQLVAIKNGIEAIGGNILLDDEAGMLPTGAIKRRETDLVGRIEQAGLRGPSGHAHFSGASIGLTPEAYRRAGGMGSLTALEDQEFEDRLAESGIEIHRLLPVQVVTSARTDGRADRGLAQDLALATWSEQRTYRTGMYSLESILESKRQSVAVILPAKEVAPTIGAILDCLLPLQEHGLIDELLVVDADSVDGTADLVRSRKVDLASESGLSPELGPVRGKGDAMWRAAREVTSDILVFLDADTADFNQGFIIGLLGPILTTSGIRLVKGTFERPLSIDGFRQEGEGGRVTELVARPLLNLHFPALSGFIQPLAGEIAIERDLFMELSIPVGYGVEIAMLIDCLSLIGIDAMAQSDLGIRQNDHQSLRDLSRMAGEIMVAVERRTDGPRRPETVAFRPRPEAGEASERWSLNCAERSVQPARAGSSAFLSE